MINFFNDSSSDNNDEVSQIMPIFTEVHGDIDFDKKKVNTDEIPVLALRNMVLFPGATIPVAVGRPKSLKLIKAAEKKKMPISVFCQRSKETEDPSAEDLYEIGVVAEILKVLELPDGSTNVILVGHDVCRLEGIVKETPYLQGRISYVKEEVPNKKDKQFDALVDALRDLSLKILSNLGDPVKEFAFAIKNIDNPVYLVNFLCSNSPLSPEQKQKLLEVANINERAFMLFSFLQKENQLIEIKAELAQRTREDLSQQQKEHFLQQQIRVIQDELGGSMQEQDIDELRKRAANMKWDDKVRVIFEKELHKLERLHPQTPDFSVQMTYLETMLDLPWNVYSNDNFNLNSVEKHLNKDHYGLEKVKDRIIEHLAVLKLRGDMKAPILCLYGPPGVGKTSLGKSIADALKRSYVRISLGGLHDEAEIRGHRRTYIGAMPGRIVTGMVKAKTSNPVFVLDEIDKIGTDFKGDPSSALLEVLDPEQNNAFHDNYMDLDIDLSKALFIATANSLATIQQPLLDRMELIDISGYILEEKVEIARRHLVPKQLANHGFEAKEIEFTKPALVKIVESYTRESGVRELDKKIAKALRHIARLKASDKEYKKRITPENLKEYLGAEEYSRDKYEGNDFPGVVTGLAWTAVGGEILFVESSLSKGKGEKLTLTGNLGDVMKESAIIALEYIKSHSDKIGIPDDMFEKFNVHVHVPEGAIPKDGPSAGVTMVTSLVSSFTHRKVKDHLAMTGEITLRGKVLPVGGIKEKILAAKRAGITDIVMSEDNRKDIEEIKDIYLKGLTFHYVKTIMEVLNVALTDEVVK